LGHSADPRQPPQEARRRIRADEVAYQQRPVRYEYRLTPKGLDLYPVLMALVHWSDVHMAGKRSRPLLHAHDLCGKHFDPVMVCSECGEPLVARQVRVHPGPGAKERVPWLREGRIDTNLLRRQSLLDAAAAPPV
jgi:hypothetical protein